MVTFQKKNLSNSCSEPNTTNSFLSLIRQLLTELSTLSTGNYSSFKRKNFPGEPYIMLSEEVMAYEAELEKLEKNVEANSSY